MERLRQFVQHASFFGIGGKVDNPSWQLCEGARLMAQGAGDMFQEPCFAKSGNSQRFFNRFYRRAG